MALEGSINENYGLERKPQVSQTIKNEFYSNNLLIAGDIKVKHPLLIQTLLIVGFVVEDCSFNQQEFIIKGNGIAYKSISGSGNNRIIYPKMIVDNKTNHFSHYFKNDIRFQYRNSGIKSPYEYKKGWSNGVSGYFYGFGYSERDIFENPYFDYYMYEKINSETPECAADVVFALCKYIDNGEFKHAIFNLYELKMIEDPITEADTLSILGQKSNL